MKKTLAIPASLMKEVLTAEEEESLRQFGDQAMTDEDLLQRQADEVTHLEMQAKRNREIIISQLDEIDRKSIRAIREGNKKRIEELETQAAMLRKQIV